MPGLCLKSFLRAALGGQPPPYSIPPPSISVSFSLLLLSSRVATRRGHAMLTLYASMIGRELQTRTGKKYLARPCCIVCCCHAPCKMLASAAFSSTDMCHCIEFCPPTFESSLAVPCRFCSSGGLLACHLCVCVCKTHAHSAKYLRRIFIQTCRGSRGAWPNKAVTHTPGKQVKVSARICPGH